MSDTCCKCYRPLIGVFYGAGDGRGQKFQCEVCYKLDSEPVRDRSHTEDYRLQQVQIAARRLK